MAPSTGRHCACRKLRLGANDHVLEIGGGWGGFALHAAGRYGCRLTTTTISPSQFELARERVRAAGLEDRVQVLLEDYRDLAGRYCEAGFAERALGDVQMLLSREG